MMFGYFFGHGEGRNLASEGGDMTLAAGASIPSRDLVLDGITGYVYTANDPSHQVPADQPFTFLSAINQTSSGTYWGLAANLESAGGGYTGWEVLVGDDIRFMLEEDYSSKRLEVRTGYAPITNGQRAEVAVTYDGSASPGGVSVYVDGVSKSLTTFSNTLSTSHNTLSTAELHIGKRRHASNPFPGTIYGVAGFEKVLSENERAVIFKSM